MAASSSPSPFFGIRDDGGFFVHQMSQPQPSSQNHQQQLQQQQQHPLVLQQPGNHHHHLHPYQQQQPQQQQQQPQQQEQQSSSTTAPTSSTAGIPAPPPLKKRRNLPGVPNPDAEVIALSPKTLLATNRFLCEVCGKGFQREQNLQLHRRGHNLPWKLKQKNPADAARRRVYVCPEPTCAHHDPSRALGDLTGIKKHFCRKHGEKKWKCDKCSKRYAVHSDWKAHSKTCGTREYRCDCGTLFSRRDSFITHRAFCDALAQESGRHPIGLGSLGGGHLYGSAASSGNLSGMGLGLSQLMHNQTQAAASSFQLGGHDGLLRLGGSAGSNQFNPLRSSSNSLVQQRSSAGFFLGGAGGVHDYNDAGAGGVSQQSQPFFETKQQLSSLMQLPNLHGSSIVGGNPQQHPSAAGEAGLFNQAGFYSGSSTSNNHHGLQMLNLPLNFNHGSVEQNGGPPAATTLPRLNLTNASAGNHHSVPPALYSGTGFHDFDPTLVPAMSATALLQKAAQMGSTMNGGGDGQPASSLFRGFGSPPHSGSTKPLPSTFSRDMHIAFGGNGDTPFLSQPAQLDSMESNHLQDLMNTLVGNGVAPLTAFGPGSNEPFASVGIKADAKLHNRGLPGGGGIGSSDGLTRDFLGVGGSGIIVGGGCLSSHEPIPISEQQHLMRRSHEDDVDVGSLFNESKAASAASRSRSFASENI